MKQYGYPLVLIFIFGCSASDLSGTSKQKKDSREIEVEEDEDSVDNPAQISGAFLQCGFSPDSIEADGQIMGCTVMDQASEQAKTCSSHSNITFRSQEKEFGAEARFPEASSSWHFFFRYSAKVDVNEVKSWSRCDTGKGWVEGWVKTQTKSDIRSVSLQSVSGELVEGDDTVDDGGSNPADDRSPPSQPTFVIFISSGTTNGKIDPNFCNNLAKTSSVPSISSTQFKNLTSSPHIPESDPSWGRQVRLVTGDLVQWSLYELLTKGPKIPINVDESKKIVSEGSNVWFSNGKKWCSGWTENWFRGGVGNYQSTGPSAFNNGNPIFCNQKSHVYCINLP